MPPTRKTRRLRRHLSLVLNDPTEPHVYVLEEEYDYLGICVYCEQMVFPFDDLPHGYRNHYCPRHDHS